jgi:hemerythrin superfamily protein
MRFFCLYACTSRLRSKKQSHSSFSTILLLELARHASLHHCTLSHCKLYFPFLPRLPYVLLQLDFLDHHHDHEDEIEFPFIHSKVDTGMFTADHEELEALLEGLHSTVELFRNVPSSYNADELTSRMRSLQSLLLPHMKAEEETITTEFLAAHFSEREVRAMHARIDEMAMRNDPTLDLALIWFSIGTEERQRTFLDAGKMPFVVSRILLPLVFLRKHKKTYWRFAMHYRPTHAQRR